jgi:cyclin A
MKIKEYGHDFQLFNSKFLEPDREIPCRDPLNGHLITGECRTKIADWMIEVTSKFDCRMKTYFLTMAIMDKFMIASNQYSHVLSNSDVHMIGITSLYLASKFNDLHPISAKMISEKTSRGSISQKEINVSEGIILKMIGLNVDFVTHYDFHETYLSRIDN